MKKLILIIVLIICSIFILPNNKIFASTASDIQQQIYDINIQVKNLNIQIQKYQQQISKNGKKKTTLARVIKNLTLTRNKLMKQKEQTQRKMTAISLIIKNLNLNINTQQQSIKNSKRVLSKMIFDIYINDSNSLMEKLLSQNNISDFSNEYNNIISVNEKIIQYITKVKNQKNTLISSKTQKVSEQQNLDSLKQNLNLQQQAVEFTQKTKNKILSATKNKEVVYKRLLAEQIRKRDTFEKNLFDYEVQLKFILNPNSLPAKGSEVLSWPLKNILVTQLFGVTSSSGRLYRSGSHSGIDFRASVGTKVMAMASGTVVDTGNTDIYCKGASFGKWVLIKYNNGLSSTFGHLSVISARAGQIVKTGDIVGLSGSTGHVTGPHLHVTVYASSGVKVEKVPSLTCNGKSFIMPIAPINAYLNPALYLPKITTNMIK